MDGFSSVAASRPLWSKTLHRKKTSGQIQRKEPAVTLPALARRPSDQHLGTIARNNSLHALLASQLEGNDREAYSRSQLRAMASSKFISNNLVPTNSRIRNNAKRLAPLDPAHFAKTKMHQFPGPLQAAINEILAVRNVGELSSEREETRPPIPRVKHTSPKKSQPYGRRPEWRRYIRRIMLTKGIQGSTLARYRRLVGIVARKNLVQNYTSAAERVVKYRLEFRCAAMIQTMILVFLNRRRQEKARRRHKAAAKIQQEWRMILERKRQRQLVKRDRLAKLDLLLRLAASRSIQRSYRKYRHACYLHEEEQRQVHQEKKLQKARLKLLQRYQLWRERLNRDKIDRNLPFTAVGEEMPSKARVDDDGKEYSNHPEQSEPCAASPCDRVVVITPRTSISSDESLRKNSKQDTIDPNLGFSAVGKDLLEIRGDVIDKAYCSVPEQSEPFVSSKSDHVPVIVPCTTVITRDESPRENSKQDGRNVKFTSVGEKLSEFHIDASEAVNNNISELREPCVSDHAKVIASCTEDESPHDLAEEHQDVLDMPEPISGMTLSELSHPEDLLQEHVNTVDEESARELAVVATATAMARTKAAERIIRFLLPKLQVRNLKKAHAATRIQCFVRLYLARQCVGRVRLQALKSLRQQLLASWQISLQNAATKEGLPASEQGTHVVKSEDEDDELDLELRDYQPSLHGLDVYSHVLPTRNGQIPPGVPMLHSSAGAPLLSLWKWSWSGEKWLINGQ